MTNTVTINVFNRFLPALLKDTNFRHVVITQPHEQWVFMKIRTKDEIPWEIHTDVDQFFMCWGDAPLTEKHNVYEIQWVNEQKQIVHQLFYPYDLFIVRHGTYHRIVNLSSQYPLRLLTVYSPAQHPEDRIQPIRVEEPPVKIDGQETTPLTTHAAMDGNAPVFLFPRYFTHLVNPFRDHVTKEALQYWISSDIDRGQYDIYGFHLVWKVYVLPAGKYQITGRHTARSFLVTYGVATLQSSVTLTDSKEKEYATYLQGGDHVSIPARASCVLYVPNDYLIVVVLQEKDKVI